MNDMTMQPPAADPLGWTVIVVGAIVTGFTIVMSVYWAIKPGEKDPEHPKYTILRDDR
jgi:nitrogen fixation-related uncharacterized protein